MSLEEQIELAIEFRESRLIRPKLAAIYETEGTCSSHQQKPISQEKLAADKETQQITDCAIKNTVRCIRYLWLLIIARINFMMIDQLGGI